MQTSLLPASLVQPTYTLADSNRPVAAGRTRAFCTARSQQHRYQRSEWSKLCRQFRGRVKGREFLLTHASSSPALTGQEEWEDQPAEESTSTSSIDESKPQRKASLLERFWKAYTDLLDRKPIFVKSMTSLVGFALGDILAQVIAGGSYNLPRTLRMTSFGILMDGPVGHLWYTLLDKNVYPKRPKSNTAVVTKMLLDQLAWAPFFSCVFFTFMCCLEGRPSYSLISIQKKLIPVLLANYAVWPIAHLINFKFIPSSQRILYINFCQVLWSSYLSACQARAN